MTRSISRRDRHPLPEHGVVPTPITEIPHLAEAARRRGETDRVIAVDAAPPQQVRTPGGQVGRWLGSGQPVKVLNPQYLSWSEIADQPEPPDADDLMEGAFDR